MTSEISEVKNSIWRVTFEALSLSPDLSPVSAPFIATWDDEAMEGPRLARLSNQVFAAQIAPDRWLILQTGQSIDPSPVDGSALVEVEGKWVCLDLDESAWKILGDSAGHLPAFAGEATSIALPLFDCPAILIGHLIEAPLLILQASYLDHWISTMNALGVTYARNIR